MATVRDSATLDELSESGRRVLAVIKEQSTASISAVARALGVSHEAARKHVFELQRRGWIGTTCAAEEAEPAAPGRPAAQYCLTPSGENLFPKDYASLVVTLVDRFGADALVAITDGVVAKLRAGTGAEASLAQRMAAARNVYIEGDPYTAVEERGDDFVMIEKNCPFLDVAMERPAICSTTVSALRRFTGRQVVRERRFQDGDGRCEFHVHGDRRARNTRFEIEPPRSDRK
jgi:predicted ArsR family transcriptional regulator